MSKPKAQGTAWETAFVRMVQDAALPADRLPEGGLRDAGDVWIGDTPQRGNSITDIAVLAWSRLIDNGGGRRVPDGLRSVIVIDTADFLAMAQLATQAGYAFVVECKAAERLNVTRALYNAKLKLLRWKATA